MLGGARVVHFTVREICMLLELLANTALQLLGLFLEACDALTVSCSESPDVFVAAGNVDGEER